MMKYILSEIVLHKYRLILFKRIPITIVWNISLYSIWMYCKRRWAGQIMVLSLRQQTRYGVVLT